MNSEWKGWWLCGIILSGRAWRITLFRELLMLMNYSKWLMLEFGDWGGSLLGLSEMLSATCLQMQCLQAHKFFKGRYQARKCYTRNRVWFLENLTERFADLHNFHVRRKKKSGGGRSARNRGGASKAKGKAKDPRSTKYQRLSREIERLCIGIRMYRLPSTTTQRGDKIFES